MPTQRLPMRKLREILRLKHESGRFHRGIARVCGVGVGTVSEYLRRAAETGLSWSVLVELDDAAVEARLFPAGTSSSPSRPLPDLKEIHQELKRAGVTLLLLWQGL